MFTRANVLACIVMTFILAYGLGTMVGMNVTPQMCVDVFFSEKSDFFEIFYSENGRETHIITTTLSDIARNYAKKDGYRVYAVRKVD